MALKETLVQAQTNAQKTLALLKDQHIRQVPRNFTIWYEYLTESNPDLVKAVNDHLANSGKFTEKIAEELYSRFFTFEKEGQAIRESNKLVQESMDNVVVSLNNTNAEFSDYGEQLSEFATKADGMSVAELQDVIGEIVSQTNTMTTNAKNLNDSLDKASKEITNLRKLLKEVQAEALTDTLTGIANRKSFDEELQRQTELATESGKSLCLMMADIDHFKKFNDTHGHPFGDQVIRLVANTLRDGTGITAMAARYGGEEFAVILPNMELNIAVDLANDLRETISAKKIIKRSTGEDVGKVTMSFGVAQYTPREDMDTLLNRADEALYEAKNGGRNQVKYIQASLAKTA